MHKLSERDETLTSKIRWTPTSVRFVTQKPNFAPKTTENPRARYGGIRPAVRMPPWPGVWNDRFGDQWKIVQAQPMPAARAAVHAAKAAVRVQKICRRLNSASCSDFSLSCQASHCCAKPTVMCCTMPIGIAAPGPTAPACASRARTFSGPIISRECNHDSPIARSVGAKAAFSRGYFGASAMRRLYHTMPIRPCMRQRRQAPI
jgi:hypothetical protein